MKLARATERKQRALAEQLMEERLESLKAYEAQLKDGERAQLGAYAEAAAKVLADATALTLPHARVRWVCK